MRVIGFVITHKKYHTFHIIAIVVRFRFNIYFNHHGPRSNSKTIPKMDEEDLKCSLCLEIFTLPVKMTRCGHSFCGQCLTGMTEATWPCPECRTVQNQTPDQLPRNYGLEPIIEKFKFSRKICSIHNLQKKLRKYFKALIKVFDSNMKKSTKNF